MARRLGIPFPRHLHPAAAYALAVVLPCAALLVQHALRSWVENIPFVLFFVVVSTSALAGGGGPGLVAVALSAVGGWWYQATSADLSNRQSAVVGALVFVPAGLFITLLGALARAGYREQEDAARELAAAVRARDDFISVASHELKTPLTSLILSVHRLSRPELAHARLDEPSAARALALISRQASRLNILVSNLLDVSRISAGRLDLDLQEVELGEVVRAAASRLEDELANAGCALQLSVASPVVGRWDRLRLEQVVTNLLSNAARYGRQSPIEVSVFELDGEAILAVSDRGAGIDPASQARIFDRFERGAAHDPAGGIGLGLWIVREVVTALAGTVTVESRPGLGAKFVVTLPMRGPEDAPAAAPARPRRAEPAA
jgi:signal transduction histidine kinase